MIEIKVRRSGISYAFNIRASRGRVDPGGAHSIEEEDEVARKTFSVTRYIYQVGYKNTATWGGTQIQIQGYVACYGDNDRFIVYGLHPNSPVPAAPVYNVSGNVGAIFVPFAELSNYVDIVRNEKPVYATLNSDRPEWMGLRTAMEPIGEEES